MPLSVREALRAWSRAALARTRSGRRPPTAGGARRRCGCSSPSSLHITLCFLGSRPVARDRRARRGARGLRGRTRASWRSGRPLWLPPRRPRALAVEIARPRRASSRALQARARARARAGERLGARAPALPRSRHGRARCAPRRARRGAAGAPRRCCRRRPRCASRRSTITLYRSWLAPDGRQLRGAGGRGARRGLRPIGAGAAASGRLREGAARVRACRAGSGVASAGSQTSVVPLSESVRS